MSLGQTVSRHCCQTFWSHGAGRQSSQWVGLSQLLYLGRSGRGHSRLFSVSQTGSPVQRGQELPSALAVKKSPCLCRAWESSRPNTGFALRTVSSAPATSLLKVLWATLLPGIVTMPSGQMGPDHILHRGQLWFSSLLGHEQTGLWGWQKSFEACCTSQFEVDLRPSGSLGRGHFRLASTDEQSCCSCLLLVHGKYELVCDYLWPPDWPSHQSVCLENAFPSTCLNVVLISLTFCSNFTHRVFLSSSVLYHLFFFISLKITTWFSSFSSFLFPFSSSPLFSSPLPPLLLFFNFCLPQKNRSSMRARFCCCCSLLHPSSLEHGTPLLTLKIKQPVIFTSEMGLFRTSRIAIRDMQTMANRGPVRRTKEKNAVFQRKRGVGRGSYKLFYRANWVFEV